MKSITAALLSFFLLNASLNAAIEQATPSEFAALIEKGNTVLVDVRTPAETKQEKLAGALEFDFLADDFAQQIESLPKDKTVLLYCRSGNRSGKAAKLLESKGYQKLVNLDGGIKAWKAADLPLATEE